MDYCFMGKRDETTQPIMVIKDRDTGMICSFLVQHKGAASDYVIKRTLAFIKELGVENADLVLKGDQEPALQEFLNEVGKRRQAKTFVEQSPVGSSASNGFIERAIQSVEGQARVVKDALELRLGVHIEMDQYHSMAV